jgi:hypothetical protein
MSRRHSSYWIARMDIDCNAINKKKVGYGIVGINIRKSGPGIAEMKGRGLLRRNVPNDY